MRPTVVTCLLVSLGLATGAAWADKEADKPEATKSNWKSYLELSQQLHAEGKQREAAGQLDFALAGAERLREGPRAEAYCQIGDQYIDIGNYAKAKSLLDEALKIKRRLPLPKGTGTARNMDHLAQACAKTGDLERAAELSEEALDIYAQNKKSQPNDYAIALANRAYIFRLQQNFGDAEKLLKEAEAVQAKVPGQETERAKTLINLCGLYLDENRLEAAQSAIISANAIVKKLPAKHPLAALICRSERVLARRQVDALLRQDANPFRSEVAVGLVVLADKLQEEGDIPQALETYKRALTIEEKIAPDDKQLQARLHEQYSQCLQRLGDKKQAAIHLDRARALHPQ